MCLPKFFGSQLGLIAERSHTRRHLLQCPRELELKGLFSLSIVRPRHCRFDHILEYVNVSDKEGGFDYLIVPT